MEGPITWEQLLGLAFIGGALGGAWWFLFAAILGVRRDLNEFRLKVAEEYASREHLKEVELRLVEAINKLSDKFEALPSKIAAAMHPPKD
ncbi:hypothetical protein [Roseibium sp.]|uniref:hypothetical protein n=1 Tax=Roseibium sp. TaxID=1936156 RepID=UPI003B50E88D